MAQDEESSSMNFDLLRDDVANGVECEVLRGTTHGIGSLLAPFVSEIDQHAARWLLSKFVTDSSAGSERRSRLCEGKKKKMEIPPEKKKLKVYKYEKNHFISRHHHFTRMTLRHHSTFYLRTNTFGDVPPHPVLHTHPY